MTLDKILDELPQLTSQEIKKLGAACREVSKLRDQAEAATLKATLKPGDRVILHGLRPKKLNARGAEVKAVRQTRVLVRIDGEFNDYTVPLTCVTKEVDDV